MDRNICSSKHIENFCCNASHAVGVLSRLRHFIQILINLFNIAIHFALYYKQQTNPVSPESLLDENGSIPTLPELFLSPVRPVAVLNDDGCLATPLELSVALERAELVLNHPGSLRHGLVVEILNERGDHKIFMTL